MTNVSETENVFMNHEVYLYCTAGEAEQNIIVSKIMNFGAQLYDMVLLHRFTSFSPWKWLLSAAVVLTLFWISSRLYLEAYF